MIWLNTQHSIYLKKKINQNDNNNHNIYLKNNGCILTEPDPQQQTKLIYLYLLLKKKTNIHKFVIR